MISLCIICVEYNSFDNMRKRHITYALYHMYIAELYYIIVTTVVIVIYVAQYAQIQMFM